MLSLDGKSCETFVLQLWVGGAYPVKVTFEMLFVEWMNFKNLEITEVALVEITTWGKLLEQKKIRSLL